MSLEDIISNAKEDAIRKAVEQLSKTKDWQTRGQMGRLYLLCLKLDTTHVRLQPLLRKMGLKL